jgi:hypothetical protein
MKRAASFLTVIAFSVSTFASEVVPLAALPAPDRLLPLSQAYSFPVMKGVKFDPDDPLNLEFVFDGLDRKSLSGEEARKLIEYFLAGLAVPEEDLWVNLSPYESDRIIPDALSVTELGRDMLVTDYILKQLSSSLTHPETETGREYWNLKSEISDRELNPDKSGSSQSFDKIWIVPDAATVYESDSGTSAFVISASLKTMTERDYMAQRMENGESTMDDAAFNGANSLLPAINRELNEGRNFAVLRQIYYSLILGVWFKKKFQDTFYRAYFDSGNVTGIDIADKDARSRIYNLYVEAFEKGVFNCERKERDAAGRLLKRRYFSGGEFFGNLSSSAINVLRGKEYKNDLNKAFSSSTALTARAVVADAGRSRGMPEASKEVYRDFLPQLRPLAALRDIAFVDMYKNRIHYPAHVTSDWHDVDEKSVGGLESQISVAVAEYLGITPARVFLKSKGSSMKYEVYVLPRLEFLADYIVDEHGEILTNDYLYENDELRIEPGWTARERIVHYVSENRGVDFSRVLLHEKPDSSGKGVFGVYLFDDLSSSGISDYYNNTWSEGITRSAGDLMCAYSLDTLDPNAGLYARELHNYIRVSVDEHMAAEAVMNISRQVHGVEVRNGSVVEVVSSFADIVSLPAYKNLGVEALKETVDFFLMAISSGRLKADTVVTQSEIAAMSAGIIDLALMAGDDSRARRVLEAATERGIVVSEINPIEYLSSRLTYVAVQIARRFMMAINQESSVASARELYLCMKGLNAGRNFSADTIADVVTKISVEARELSVIERGVRKPYVNIAGIFGSPAFKAINDDALRMSVDVLAKAIASQGFNRDGEMSDEEVKRMVKDGVMLAFSAAYSEGACKLVVSAAKQGVISSAIKKALLNRSSSSSQRQVSDQETMITRRNDLVMEAVCVDSYFGPVGAETTLYPAKIKELIREFEYTPNEVRQIIKENLGAYGMALKSETADTLLVKVVDKNQRLDAEMFNMFRLRRVGGSSSTSSGLVNPVGGVSMHGVGAGVITSYGAEVAVPRGFDPVSFGALRVLHLSDIRQVAVDDVI